MGGACSSANDTGNNFSPDMTNYLDLTIGQSFTHPGYCDWCTESSVNCGNNSEFIPDGNGQGMCKCRALCNDGCCRKKCSRQTYSGDIDLCCQSGGNSYYTDTQNIVRTCDPQYRINNWQNKTCDKSMTSYCKKGNNLFNTACRQWITTFQPTGDYSKAVGNGAVDDVILDVCSRQENINKQECGCIAAANLVRNKFPDANDIPVQCLVNSCANNPGAYRTSNQLQPCEVVNCQISVDDLKLVAADHSTFNVNFAQNCSSKSNKTNLPTTPSNSPTNTSNSPTNTSNTPPNIHISNSSNSGLIIFIILGVVVLITIIGIVAYMRKKHK